MYMKKFKQGFTLIELIVVIALIGIMSGIVVAALSSAKKGGEDAAIQSSLTKMQTQSELYYSSFNNYGSNSVAYEDVCPTDEIASTTAGLLGVSGLGLLSFTKDLVSRVGSVNTLCTVSSNGARWAVASVLKEDDTRVACVDSTGGLKISNIGLSSSITSSVCN